MVVWEYITGRKKHAWQETFEHSGGQIKPWPWADTWPVARLQVERLGVDLIVLEGESGEVLAFGPGHLPTSSDIGTAGHAVLAGHRDTSFRFLQNLKKGDVVMIQTMDGIKSRYLVSRLEVHDSKNLYLQQRDVSFWSMITCYPFYNLQYRTNLRFIVSTVESHELFCLVSFVVRLLGSALGYKSLTFQ